MLPSMHAFYTRLIYVLSVHHDDHVRVALNPRCVDVRKDIAIF